MNPRPPRRYLSRPEIAARIGVQRASLPLSRLPPPDALTGRVRGWLPGTVDAWDAGRRKRDSSAGDLTSTRSARSRGHEGET